MTSSSTPLPRDPVETPRTGNDTAVPPNSTRSSRRMVVVVVLALVALAAALIVFERYRRGDDGNMSGSYQETNEIPTPSAPAGR